MNITIRGSGRVEVAAYGFADAEATVQKELKAIFPGATVQVLDVRRTDPDPRIVEIFEVAYALRVTFPAEATDESPEAARRKAFAAGRSALLGTRFERTVWEG